MKLIEALIIAQQEYGIYGDWKAHHMGNALSIGRESSGFYSAYDGGVGVFSRSDRLETVLADLAKRYPYEAKRYPYEALDDQWKVSRWEVYQS